MLSPQLEKHGIKLGRDQLYDLSGFHGLLIRRRKRIVKTTNSHHWLKKYPNLIKELTLSAAEQLWVSDITYIRTLQGFSYLSLITDAYSRKIVGYGLCETLKAIGPIEALVMAIQERQRVSPIHSYPSFRQRDSILFIRVCGYIGKRRYCYQYDPKW